MYLLANETKGENAVSNLSINIMNQDPDGEEGFSMSSPVPSAPDMKHRGLQEISKKKLTCFVQNRASGFREIRRTKKSAAQVEAQHRSPLTVLQDLKMSRRNDSVRSLPEKEVEMADGMRKLMMYCKPVMLYNILHTRTLDNPYFLPRRLSYKIQAKKLKDKTNSGGEITFNYMDRNNNEKIRAEVVDYFSCPFCSMKCGGHEGLKFHLTSSHDFFEYKFRLSGNDHPEIDVSLKSDAFTFGELSDGLEMHHKIPFTYLGLKSRKRLQSNAQRLNVHLSEMDLNDSARDIENELSHANDDNVSSPPRAHYPENNGDILTITEPEIAQSSEPEIARSAEPEIARSSEPEIAQSSEPKVLPVSRRKMLYAEWAKAKRIECLKKQQFYHSKTSQPMPFEQVMSDVDSETEVDHEFADTEERTKLAQLVNVSDEDKCFMWLWNTFVSKQRVVAYGHVPWACEEFTKLHVKELISTQYFWQWKLFMVKLWNHGLLGAETMDKCNTFLLNAQEAAAAAGGASSSTSQATTAIGNEQQQPAASSSSTSPTTTANCNEQQQHMELDAERE